MNSNTENQFVNVTGSIFIKYLPRDKILYRLWKHAKKANQFYYCNDTAPILTEQQAREDINYMLQDKRKLELTTYYGRVLFLDISGDYLDTFTYNIYNGDNAAEDIIRLIKIEELSKVILNYHIEK